MEKDGLSTQDTLNKEGSKKNCISSSELEGKVKNKGANVLVKTAGK